MRRVTNKTTREQFETTNEVPDQTPAKRAWHDTDVPQERNWNLETGTTVPHELMMQIFSECEASDVLAAGEVCRSWYNLSKADILWNSLLRRDFMQPEATDPKETYRECYRIDRNMAKGVYASHFLKEHEDILNCVVIDNGNVYSCSNDNTIRIWNLDAMTYEKKLIEHNGEIECLAADNDTLCSASEDGVIKVWDAKTGQCKITFNKNAGKVKCLAIARGEVYSGGSADRTVKVWDLNTGDLKMTLLDPTECEEEKPDAVCSIAISNDMLIVGFVKGKIEIRNLTTNEIKRTSIDHTDCVTGLAVHGDRLFSCSEDRTIRTWDLKTGVCKTLLAEDDDIFTSIAIGNGKLFSCCANGSAEEDWIRVWDFTTSNQKAFAELAHLLEEGSK